MIILTVHFPSGGCDHSRAKYLAVVAEQMQAGYIGGQEDQWHSWTMEEVDGSGKAST